LPDKGSTEKKESRNVPHLLRVARAWLLPQGEKERADRGKKKRKKKKKEKTKAIYLRVLFSARKLQPPTEKIEGGDLGKGGGKEERTAYSQTFSLLLPGMAQKKEGGRGGGGKRLFSSQRNWEKKKKRKGRGEKRGPLLL